MKLMNLKLFIMKLMITLFLVSQCYGFEKAVYIPTAFSTVEAYKNWSYDRSYQSENFVIFWGKKVGNNPISPPAEYADLAFNPEAIADTLEKTFDKYINEIKFVSNDSTSNLGKYKLIIIMNDTWSGDGAPEGWAFGGQYEGVIGAMWVHPGAVANGLVTSHELVHSLQSMFSIDENEVGGGYGGGYDFAGFFWETHANFMRTQMYPIMAEDDMPRWLATRMYHWSSTRHHYISYHPLFTLQELYGIEWVNKLWRESIAQEHPLETLKRLKSWQQSDLNDFMYESAKREVIFDWNTNDFGNIMRNKRDFFREYEAHHLWREYTLLEQTDSVNNSYIVNSEWAPQDYGVNLIPLHSTCSLSNKIKVNFKGHLDANHLSGWRYGFVAESQDGKSARYSEVYYQDSLEMMFEYKDDEKVYFVVMGAPTAHTNYAWEPGWPKIYRYPYEVAFENCVPEGYQQDFRSNIKSMYPGAEHVNGGGWVANTASVDASVYVGPKAVVLGNSKITDNVQIRDNAWVENYTISDNVVVSSNAQLYGNYYEIAGNIVSGDAQVMDAAVLNGTIVKNSAIVKNNALAWGGEYSGTAVVGGDAEVGDRSSGVYLQVPHNNNGRTENDGLGADHISNIDVNNTITEFSTHQIVDFIGCSEETLTVLNDFKSQYNHQFKTLDYIGVSQHYVEIDNHNQQNLKVKIFNSCGKEVYSNTITNEKTFIKFSDIVSINSTVNYVALFQLNKLIDIESFKIIK